MQSFQLNLLQKAYNFHSRVNPKELIVLCSLSPSKNNMDFIWYAL